MPVTIESLKRARDAGLDDDRIIASIERNDPEMAERFSSARSKGLDNKRILSAYERRLSSELVDTQTMNNDRYNRPQNASNGHREINASQHENREGPDVPPQSRHYNTSSNSTPLNTSTMLPNKPGYADYFRQGLTQSATGEITNIGKAQEQIAEDPNFWQALVQESGNIAGDAPFLLAGGSLGASAGAALGSVGGPFGVAAGALLGGGAGALALPEFLKSSLQEYRDYTQKGHDITYGEFLERADRVATKTLKSGIMGAILGTLSKAAPLLKEAPGIGKLFTSKIAQKASNIGIETSAIATIPKVTEGELPTKNDFASALALVLGFNALRIPKAIKDEIQKRGEASGLTPEEFAKTPEAKEIANEINETDNQSGEVPIEQPKAESNQKTEAPKENVKPKAGEQIIETTGQGAEERLEQPKTKLEKLKDTASNTTDLVKNFDETRHQIYTKSFDALEPINRLEKDIPVSERVTTKIKQAQSAASDINNILTQGIFDNVSDTFSSGSLKDVYNANGEIWQRAVKGLKPADYSINEMDVYRTSKEALKRQKRGLKSGIDTEIAKKDVERLKQKYGPIDQRLQQFQKKPLDHYGKDLLNDKTRLEWSQNSHASLYRVMDYGKDSYVAEGSLAPKKPWHKAKGSERKIIPPSESDIQNLSMLVTNAKKNDSVLQYKKLVEAGKLPGKIVKSKNKEMPSKMVEELGIDPESTELAETLYNQSRKDAFSPETGRIRGWENGKPFEIEVPNDVYETYSSLAPADTGMFTNIFRSTNNLMSKGIVLEPTKFVSIFGRDALSSLIYSKTGSNPVSIVRALTDIYKDTHAWNQFKSLGGEQYASRLMTRTERVQKIEELLKAERPNAIMVPFKEMASFLKKHSQNLVASVPFAEYQRSVKKFGDTPSGRLAALIESKSVTYDPTKRGSSKNIKNAANFFPFFNVMLQEPAMIAKNLKRPQFIAKGIAGITLPSLLLKMYNEGNPDYDDMNPILKASCWHFYTENGHYALPIPWLLGATFKAAPEVLYDMLKGQGGESFKGLTSYVASQLSGSFPPIVQAAVEQSTNHSLPSPVGLALKPFTDVEKRAPPVVPKRLESLPPEQQYTSKTSQLARMYGSLWKVSPVKVERLIKTFGGGIASDSLAMIDELAYWLG